MQARHRELVQMAKGVDGIEIVDSYTTNGRAEVQLRAPNGQGKKFFLSLRGGLRDSINTRKQIERFALDNPAIREPATPASPEKLRALQEKVMYIVPPTTPAMPQQTTPRPTLTVSKPAPDTPAERALTNVEYLHLAMWVRESTLADYCDADATAAAASVKFDVYISERVLREVIGTMKAAYPSAWDKPVDPITVLADMVAKIAGDLNIEPTPEFLKLASALHKG